jgi:predicted GNAT family acetyltransferase
MELSGPFDVVDHVEGAYYEVRVSGHTAGAMLYRRIGRRRAIQAVAIDAPFRGRGLARVLMSRALDDVRAQGETISSHCPVLDQFLLNHPQYQDLVDPDHPLRTSARDASRPDAAG